MIKILFNYKHPLSLPIEQALLSHVKKNSSCIGRKKTQDIFIYIAGNYKEISVVVTSIRGV